MSLFLFAPASDFNCCVGNTTWTACRLGPRKVTHPSQSWWHALDANVGLLVLVDQAHQLLCVLSIHQHHRTRREGKGVCLSELAVACLGRKERKI